MSALLLAQLFSTQCGEGVHWTAVGYLYVMESSWILVVQVVPVIYGAILGRITSYCDDSFTSQLIVNSSLDLIGKEIERAFDDGTNRITVNTSTVRIRIGGCLNLKPPLN